MNVVYLSREIEPRQQFFSYLGSKIDLLSCAPLQKEIERLLEIQKIDAVIGFEAQLNMIKSIIQHFPMINYALISSLPADEFHEATEGYGFFMQIPPAPQQEDAEKFIQLLTAITVGTETPAEKG